MLRIVVLGLCVALLASCRGKQESREEETIHIVVERETPSGKTGKAEESGKGLRRERKAAHAGPEAMVPSEPRTNSEPETAATPEEDFGEVAGEPPMDLSAVHEEVRRMIEGDARLRELIKEGKAIPVCRYLLAAHDRELDDMIQRLPVKKKRLVAFQISRSLIRKERIRERTE